MIIGFAAYYKNDRPDGLGFRVVAQHPRDTGPAVLAKQITGEGLDLYDAGVRREGNADFLWQQLDSLGRQKPLSQDAMLLAGMNIAWLELRGHLTPDEFNGIQIIEVPDDMITADLLQDWHRWARGEALQGAWVQRAGSPDGATGDTSVPLVDEAHYGSRVPGGQVFDLAAFRRRRKR